MARIYIVSSSLFVKGRLFAAARLEDEKLARLRANERTAALMNGRPLVDLVEGVAFIPDGKVAAVKVR